MSATGGFRPALTRRHFLRGCAACAAVACAGAGYGAPAAGTPRAGPPAAEGGREALFWEALPDGRVKCMTCPNHCVREDGGTTACRTRVNRKGRLHSLTYGKPCLVCEDPLAKNPLYHVDPGASAIGVATAGCNLTCRYCQNWDISQVGPSDTRNMDLPPRDLARKAAERGLHWITFSYTEPAAYLEYLVDTAKEARSRKVRIAASTSGHMTAQALTALLNSVDAVSITLKSFSKTFYREVCGCDRDVVLESIKTVARSGKWMEVVTLLVPGRNDSEEEVRSIARFLAGLNRNIPLHFLRFVPAYRMANLPPTPIQTLEKARSIAVEEGLRFVYLDVSGHQWANTVCPQCGKVLIERAGFTVVRNALRRNLCPQCGRGVPGLLLAG